MVDQTTYDELKEALDNTQMAIRSGRPRYALDHLGPLLEALFDEVFSVEEEVTPVEEEETQVEEPEEPAETEEEDSDVSSEIEELTSDNKRDELDEMAAELGVEEPEKLATKSDVAEAIVAARKS